VATNPGNLSKQARDDFARCEEYFKALEDRRYFEYENLNLVEYSWSKLEDCGLELPLVPENPYLAERRRRERS